MSEFIEHASIEGLAAAVAARIETDVRAGQARRGSAALALAGGSTPLPAYHLLARSSPDWNAVWIVPTDERWVAADHPDRNDQSILRALHPLAPQLMALVPEQVGEEVSTAAATQSLQALAEPFDHVLLGMGEDGHFASLFPGASRAAIDTDGRDDVAAVHPDPMPSAGPHPRISLTLPRLLNARRITLVATGKGKRETLERARASGTDPRALPVAALLRAGADRLAILWSPGRNEA